MYKAAPSPQCVEGGWMAEVTVIAQSSILRSQTSTGEVGVQFSSCLKEVLLL